MLVIAKAGIKVPHEFKPRTYITDAQSVDMPESAYYHRRIADGDLILADQAATVKMTVVDKSKGAK